MTSIAPPKCSVCLFVLLLLCALTASCTRGQGWHLKDVSGLIPELEFTLTDDEGRRATARDYRGKVTLLFLGYTHCRDVCPTTLATVAAAMRAAGPGGIGFRVLFVTVDPARDSTKILHDYVTAFGPEFAGLRGTDRDLEDLARRYRVAYSKGRTDAHGNYEMNHSSAVFVFDHTGRARLMILPKDNIETIAGDIKRLASIR